MESKPDKPLPSEMVLPGDEPIRAHPLDIGNSQTSRSVKAEIHIAERQLSMTVPPSEIIQDYLPYYPEAANKFFQWAEEEAAHRRKMDEAMVTSQIKDGRLGQWLGFVIALVGLGVAAAAAYWGQPWVAGILGGGTIVSLATAFIRGKPLIFDAGKRSKGKK